MKILKIFFAAIPSLIVLFFSPLIGPGRSPFIGDFTSSIANFAYPDSVMAGNVIPVSFWYLPFIMYIVNVMIIIYLAIKLYMKSSDLNSDTSIIFYSKKQKCLLLLIILIPLLFGLSFGIASAQNGPVLLLGIALPLIMKSICIILMTLFMFNIINEIVIQNLSERKE